MNKKELIKAIAVTSELRVVDVAKVMNAFGAILLECMEKEEVLSWYGVGTFSVRKYKSRIGHSPFTGLRMQIPARKVVRFSAGAALREAVMKGQNEADC